ncbi:MAG: DNA polymerase III subunit chi [Gammaproteobacteria bacterium]|nr:DNA polymerase III subunit chi [Gammaproteobacteria bacterium]MCF6230492.1 DNA polymerase III subunit chi [Gammaproteobacteria bacterium]
MGVTALFETFMTQVDFYILKNPPDDGLTLLTCRLAEKAYHKGHYTYIHTTDQAQSQLIDDLLWRFREESFIPHCQLLNEEDQAQVMIGYDREPPLDFDLLINLAGEVPLFFSRFVRVVEVVGCDEEQKLLARERFRFYRDRGYPLNSHNITL